MDPIKILYEDNMVIVAVKPSGVLSQSDGSGAHDMLSLLKEYIKEKYDKKGNVFLALVHRLDRNVEGVMVFARNSKAAGRLSSQIREHRFRKIYRAQVMGKVVPKKGTLRNYCTKDEKSNFTKVTDLPPNGGATTAAKEKAKLSELEYETVGYGMFRGKETTTVEICLHTGRSHQIRAQFAHIGHPLVGDVKYGGPSDSGRVRLKSCLLGFYHPVSGEFMEFSIP